jgi:hypothetical protein
MSGKPTGPTYAARARFVSNEEVEQATKLKKSDFIGTVFPDPLMRTGLSGPCRSSTA